MTSVCFWFQVLQMFLILFGMHMLETLESSGPVIRQLSLGGHMGAICEKAPPYPKPPILSTTRARRSDILGDPYTVGLSLTSQGKPLGTSSHRKHLPSVDVCRGKLVSFSRREPSCPDGLITMGIWDFCVLTLGTFSQRMALLSKREPSAKATYLNFSSIAVPPS